MVEHTEYSQLLEQFTQTVDTGVAAERVQRESYTTANSLRRHLEQLRRGMLEELLEVNGLGVCGEVYSHKKGLGVFPRGEMRLLYRGTLYKPWARDLKTKFSKLELLCAEHFPKDPNKFLQPDFEDREVTFTSEVLERDGKLVTVVNNIDLTGVPLTVSYTEEVYHHLGLPELPPYPKFL